MVGRNKDRKRNVPARLREEMWFLVNFEDDNNLRVLSAEEIQHIFPDDENDEIQIGDVVNALWSPNGQFYDARVLQQGGDRNELMKERVKLEKAKKNGQKQTEVSTAHQKRKQPEGETDSGREKKKAKKQTENGVDKEKKAKEREEKRKKKDEDQQRQKLLQEARKAQARSRWSASSSDDTDSDIIAVTPPPIFTPEPVRQASSNPASKSSTRQTSTAVTPSQIFTPEPVRQASSNPVCQSSTQPTSSIRPTNPARSSTPPHNVSYPSVASCHSSPQLTPAETVLLSDRSHAQSNQMKASANCSTSVPEAATHRQKADETPTISRKTKNATEPRRGLHFQNVGDESSGDEHAVNFGEGCVIPSGSCHNCCKEQKLENEALRKRLEKTHRRLSIALKAKTSEQVVNSRPVPGVLDRTLAEEYKMVEVMEGSGVFWYPHQRAYCSAFKSWPAYINAAIDMFFSKETLAISCAKGNENKSKTSSSHQPLNSLIVHALVGKVCSKYSAESPLPSQIVQKINMKCVEARRPPRVRVN